LTDFENTCLIVTLGLITNVINKFDVDFIMPITLSDENMKRAHFRDAILNQKFWFKVNCLKNPENLQTNNLEKSDYLQSNEKNTDTEQKYEELYIYEILQGKPELGFPGIFELIRKYMELEKYSKEHVE